MGKRGPKTTITEKGIFIGFYADADVVKKLDKITAERQHSRSTVLRDIIRSYLKSSKRK